MLKDAWRYTDEDGDKYDIGSSEADWQQQQQQQQYHGYNDNDDNDKWQNTQQDDSWQRDLDDGGREGWENTEDTDAGDWRQTDDLPGYDAADDNNWATDYNAFNTEDDII